MVAARRWVVRLALGLAGLYAALCTGFVTTALVLGLREERRQRALPRYVFPAEGPGPTRPAPAGPVRPPAPEGGGP